MPEDFQFDVFLSHCAQDKPVVRELATRLKADGVRVWLDEEQIKPGDSIPAKVEAGLEGSRVLVLCMSAQAFGSDWAQLEAGTFRFRDPLNKERRFIPLRLDDAPVKGSLAQFLFINWHPLMRDQEYAKLLKELCDPEGIPKQIDETPIQPKRKVQSGQLPRNPESPEPSPARARVAQGKKLGVYPALALGAFICALITMALLLWQADKLEALGLVGSFYYIILLTLGLFVAAFLFGAMRSYATYKGKQMGGVLELGGPVVGFALVVIGGFMLGKPVQATFPLTVYVHGEGGKQDIVAKNTGFVLLDLDGERRHEAIGDQGQAFFPAVPSHFHQQPVPVSVDLPGFETVSPGPFPLKGNSLYLFVRKQAQHIAGWVHDQAGKNIPSVEVSTSGIVTNADATGYFNLVIPADRLKAEMSVQVAAPGYLNKTVFATPGANELIISLERQP